MLTLQQDERIFFNGDSITDAGRDRADFHSLSGYTAMVHADLGKAHEGIVCVNRGISGNRSADVLARIRGELAEIRPTLFCMLIGINDVWRRYDRNDPTTTDAYAENVAGILEAVSLYTRRMILLEPFLIPSGPDRAEYYADLMPKILTLRALARKFNAEYIPLDGLFAAAPAAPAAYSNDGVHLTAAGNRFVADAILARLL